VSLRDVFWLLAGSMTTVVAVFVAYGMSSGNVARATGRSLRVRALGIVATLAVISAVIGIYLWSGDPGAIDRTTEVHPPNAQQGNGTAGSLEEATRSLAQRLYEAGGSAADWELLAQSYEYLGRPEDARAARAAAAGNGVLRVAAADAPSAGRHQTELARADSLRRARDFEGARDVYKRLAAQGALDADAWADYADVVASLQGGKLAGEPARYVAEALRADPDHAKGLWLDASLAHEEHRYADALASWRKLKSVLPAESPDQAIIDGNIAEAAKFAGVLTPARVGRITGTVELAPKFLGSAPAKATLFIYAKNPDAAGPPLAVVRLPAARWPVSFVLDESSAMMPGRNLSTAGIVRVEARISASGNALPQRGDLIGSVAGVDPRSGRPVHIAIDREIG
jgi:cytochrome c-type biogenesis protein CcmH